ncbi:MAG: hypothetical protein M1274_11260 [Actinobacteria bacterium]|nr:hypothetical protein [Actinomycetota bacterium]
MRPLRTIAVILGVLFALAGVASITAGGFVLGLYRSQSGASGFFMTPSRTVGSNGFALTAPDINGQLGSGWQTWGLSRARATVRVTGSSKLPVPVFIGVGPTSLVSAYLSGVARDRIASIDLTAGSVDYDHVDGSTAPAPPQEQSFWVAKAAGTGSQTLEWALQEGEWALVIMNGDASAPVAADVKLGARFGIVFPLIIGLTAAGVVLLAIGATLMVFGPRPRQTAAQSRVPLARSRVSGS